MPPARYGFSILFITAHANRLEAILNGQACPDQCLPPHPLSPPTFCDHPLRTVKLNSLFREMFSEEPTLGSVVAEDLLVHAMTEASLPDVLTTTLFHKGFTALTSYRLMHWLWHKNRKSLARYLQSVCSEVSRRDRIWAQYISRELWLWAEGAGDAMSLSGRIEAWDLHEQHDCATQSVTRSLVLDLGRAHGHMRNTLLRSS